MKIKSIKHSEISTLIRISKQTFIDTYSIHNTPENLKGYLDENLSESKITEQFQDNNCHFYFGKINNKVIGYLKLNTGSAQTATFEPNAIEIERIYILKSHHKKGLGSELINFAIEKGKEWNNSLLWLGVWSMNEGAIEFYKKIGFTIFDEHYFTLGNEEQLDYLMKVDL